MIVYIAKKNELYPHLPLKNDLPQHRLDINGKPFQNTGTDVLLEY